MRSGAHLSYLPLHVIQPVVNLLSATKSGSNYYEFSCEIWGDYAFKNGRVDFGFGNLTISVPMVDLAIMTDDELCLLGVAETDDPMVIPYVLGESFLKSAFGGCSSNLNLHSLSLHHSKSSSIKITRTSISLKGQIAVPTLCLSAKASTLFRPCKETASLQYSLLLLLPPLLPVPPSPSSRLHRNLPLSQ